MTEFIAVIECHGLLCEFVRLIQHRGGRVQVPYPFECDVCSKMRIGAPLAWVQVDGLLEQLARFGLRFGNTDRQRIAAQDIIIGRHAVG